MTTTIEDRRRVLLADLVNRSDLDPRVDARFAEHYYRHVLTPELLQRHPEDLLGIITSHLELAGRRRPGDILVRAFKPEVSCHGWGPGSTIVQVVVDDSPSIVDSIIADVRWLGADWDTDAARARSSRSSRVSIRTQPARSSTSSRTAS